MSFRRKDSFARATSLGVRHFRFVKKKDGSHRMFCDYRELNKVTIKNRYPLPRIDDLINQLQGAAWFRELIFVRVSTSLSDAFRHRYCSAAFVDLMDRIYRPMPDRSVIVFIGEYGQSEHTFQTLEGDESLNYGRGLWRSVDRKVKRPQNKEIGTVKVQWQHRKGSEWTWEPEAEMREKYLELFAD
ncbi:hypothetical protein OSB04_024033 [Centaurea solstitialis]|uniref:Chromo domain-containing protein n=1 Tax=Centaurea solstitialis TaxID=347529 RepID=A0AA38WDH4_9ASTR|nr:hypothetical protein OSB04_024033 [Centaurea solstitialis]